MSYARIQSLIDEGNLVLLDGGTGTELERRGVPMNPNAWCGAASLEHLDTLMEIHGDYLEAGANIITANTYASSKLMLRPAGLADRFEDLNKAAVAAARKACELSGRDNVIVAGSLSHMVPLESGTDKTNLAASPSSIEIEDAFHDMAGLLKAEGCDLILLEMMYRPELTLAALRAAASTGLPVWCGFAARRGEDGAVLSFHKHDDIAFADLVQVLDGFDVSAAGVMHTPSDLVAQASEIVRQVFDGPLYAYPDSGHFKMPNWQFEDVISPQDLKTYAAGWMENDIRILGGCCGLSPDHIAAMAELRGH